MPSATSLILSDLVQLSSITNESRFLNDAMKTLKSESKLIDSAPIAAVVATTTLHNLLQSHPEKFDESFEVTMANSSPVRMSCDQSSVNIKAGGSVLLTVKLRMAIGWHVNSHAPGNEYAIPLSFKSLDDNVSLDVTWPQDVTMVSAGESVNVYGGSLSFPITVSANQGAKGPVKIMVTWQACNEETCLAPETTNVPCSVTVE
jgi:DsbC/DsbD-like thiol-disulfide interchange protein